MRVKSCSSPPIGSSASKSAARVKRNHPGDREAIRWDGGAGLGESIGGAADLGAGADDRVHSLAERSASRAWAQSCRTLVTMILLITGLAVTIVTGLVFWKCLPRDGKTHRFVGTELEPYVSVAFCSAIALGFTMILSAVLDLLG